MQAVRDGGFFLIDFHSVLKLTERNNCPCEKTHLFQEQVCSQKAKA